MDDILIIDANKHFGVQLRDERKRLGLTQSEVALAMGSTSSAVCHFEKGDKTRGCGSISTALDYAKALGLEELSFALNGL